MTTWRDISEQLTLKQMAELAAGEGLGLCDEALLLTARDYAAANLRAQFNRPSRRGPRPRR